MSSASNITSPKGYSGIKRVRETENCVDTPVAKRVKLDNDLEQGDVDAQNNLGLCYKNGDGVEKNLELAFYWFQKSAEQGNADAQYQVGYCYENGEGVEKNLELAFHWFQKSVEQGNADAQNYLGVCYGDGEGVEKNVELAFHWFQKSAEQGHTYAQYNLGVCYEYGKGVEKNLELAFHWYQKSADPSDVDACHLVISRKRSERTIGEFYQLRSNEQKLQTENEQLKAKIAELEITVPIEGGSEYQEAKKRFELFKTNLL